MNYSHIISSFDSSTLAERLNNGSAALFPTDTLPALAASPKHASQLWEIKQRPKDKPLILMGSCSNQLFEFIAESALKDAKLIAKLYWPGALTLILPAKGPIVDSLNPGGSNLGMRIPDCEVTLELLSKSGPLATTSANLAGESPFLCAEEASKCFPDLPALGPVPWPVSSGCASTVIIWRGSENWQVLRRGAVILENLLN